jgi:hypothetical protein
MVVDFITRTSLDIPQLYVSWIIFRSLCLKLCMSLCSATDYNMPESKQIFSESCFRWHFPKLYCISARVSEIKGTFCVITDTWQVTRALSSDKKMSRRVEGRVQSSKRRQHMSLRNQYAELTINYDELLKENKLLKQIQVTLTISNTILMDFICDMCP